MKMTEIPVGHVARNATGQRECLIRCKNVSVWLNGSGDSRSPDWFRDEYEDLGPFASVFTRVGSPKPITDQVADWASAKAARPMTDEEAKRAGVVTGTGQPVRPELTEGELSLWGRIGWLRERMNSLEHEIASLTAMYQSLSERVAEGERDRAGLRYTMDDLRDDVERDRSTVSVALRDCGTALRDKGRQLNSIAQALCDDVREGG